MENSIRKRLSLQSEILKWLNDFSEKLQQRANAATLEVHELLDQTDIVEQDMKNTLNSFRSLSYIRFIENKVYEEDEISGFTGENAKKAAEVSIPAQSYEADILPRYKEALSLGLSSYRNHMQKTNRSSSSGSVFKTGLACDPLPHIIGSEEYIHDNSCGLTVDSPLERISLDFSHAAELKGLKEVSSYEGNLGLDAMFSEDLFGGQEGPSEKEGTEPLVSAVLDFKAMLEAALLSPYKFYDEESSSLSDIVHLSEQNNVTSTVSDSIDIASSQRLTGIMDTIVPVTPGNLTSFQNSDFQTHKICSALISGSLFDTEEDSPQSIHESHEVFSTEDNTSRHAGGETLVGFSEKDIMHDSQLEDDGAVEKYFKHKIISSTLLSSPDGSSSVVGTSETTFKNDGSVSHDPEEGKSTCVCSVTVQGGDGLEGHSQISNDPRGCLNKDSFVTIAFSDQTMEGFSRPVDNKFDDSGGDDDKNDISHS